MRQLLAFFFILSLASFGFAADTGNTIDMHKVPIPSLPGVPDGREGGETIATAFPIPGLPYTDTGYTCDNINNYDAACPYTSSTSPDVVYSFTPSADDMICVDLCLSTYDTKVYIVNASGTVLACNDDAYFGTPPECWIYSSLIENFAVTAGTTYYIVVDGYGGDCGNYNMDVYSCQPCEVTCPPDGALPEGEPPLVNYYVDNWNGGCNSTPPVFQPIDWAWMDDECGWLCGVSGWYSGPGSYRDTDWFPVTAAGFTMSMTVCAEFSCNIYVLNTDCANIQVLYSGNTGGNCNCATVTWPTSAGQQFILWVGPDVFAGPAQPFEFDYTLQVCGHAYTTVPTEANTWGAVKEMYR